jgi:glutathione peroxidase
MAVFSLYVVIVNKNSRNMTGRQKVLRAVYPAFSWITRSLGKKEEQVLKNTKNIQPAVPLYELTVKLINGNPWPLNSLKGKKILIVNTASDCGYTPQFDDLQKLQEKYKDRLVIIGFPSNDFKEQEKGTDGEIESFCKKNYGISFPLASKSSVIAGNNQNPVFKWLTDPSLNGWNSQVPVWNFSKYLVDPNGMLLRYFAPSISPVSDEIIQAIEN